MAKKNNNGFTIQMSDLTHYRKTEQYARAVKTLFDTATKEIAEAAAKADYNPDKPFSFSDYPKTKAVMEQVTNELASKVTATITAGTENEWVAACKKNDTFIATIMDTSKLSKEQLNQMQDRNLEALGTFQKRKIQGMSLSERVWKYVGQYKEQIETSLDVGLGEGRSAQQLARDVKQNLNDPDRLFRRVRDKRGNLVLSKSARAYHPGRGVYRSSVKNAQRLTRSEINMAYRESDWRRWQSLDFVVGYEVRRSTTEPIFKCDLCEKLVGRYPKQFKFVGWHPQCMCIIFPILMDDETFNKNELADLKAALNGKEYDKYKAKNEVTDVPKGFKEWVGQHKDAQKKWASTPYFIRDNFKDGQLSKGLSFAVTPVIATPATAPATSAQQTSKLDSVVEAVKQFQSTVYNEVANLAKSLTVDEIVTKVGGGDLTSGSCSSVALTYIANRCGYDVLDFRGGSSREFFSRRSNISSIATGLGGKVIKHTNDFTAFKTLLKDVKDGHEYYFSCGKHAAIIRKNGKDYEYLELQSATENGFKKLNSDVLKRRFGAVKSHSIMGQKYDVESTLIDVESFKNDASFKKVMGYINTQSTSQQKGTSGTIK